MTSESPVRLKRRKRKVEHPNPLFEMWLKEWQTEARERDSDLQYCYAKALKSLRKYPLPLKSGRDCRILQNFGTKLCGMLDKKLDEFKQMCPQKYTDSISKAAHFSPSTLKAKAELRRQCNKSGNADKIMRKSAAKVRNKTTVRNIKVPRKRDDRPAHQLSPEPVDGESTNIHVRYDSEILECVSISGNSIKHKSTLLESIQQTELEIDSCNVLGKYVKPKCLIEPSSEVGTGLFNNDAHKVRSSVAMFSLQTSSRTITSASASTIVHVNEKERETRERLLAAESSETNFSKFVIPGGSFRIVLLIDVAETSGNHSKSSKTALISELKNMNVNVEIRHLNVGDFAWICQDVSTKNETVLPYIVERKRADDFAKSIKDGRFHEQKFRLKKCGLPNVIYLVESHGSNQHLGLPLSTVQQAAANTQIVDEFIVARSSGQLGTIKYLNSVSQFITKMFQDKMIMSCQKDCLPPILHESSSVSLMTFDEFNKTAKKKMQYTVKEMFIKQLIQLHGMSVSKAAAIVQIYPTPLRLMKAYIEGGGEDLLSNISYGKVRRKIGPVLSKTIYQFYCKV